MREHAGRAITLANFGRGDIFGELAMFGGERRSATVEALERTEALAILGADMHRFLHKRPEVAAKLLEALAAQLVDAERGTCPATHDPIVRATQSQIAELADCSRESASRFLAVLERAEVITQGRGKLVVHDAAALGRYVY